MENFEQYFGFDIREHIKEIVINSGETILKEGEPPQYLYYLIKGRAKLFVSHRNGKRTIINFLEAPCFIGEMELFDDERPAHGVSAMTPCTCYRINLANCRTRLKNDVVFLQYLCRCLSDKALKDVSNYTKNQSYSLKARLAAFIRTTELDGIYRERHTEAAEYLGVSYRHLLYVLANFTEQGILEKCSIGYRIKDAEALRRLEE